MWGLQARLGMRWRVQLHMDAIRRLLDLGKSRTIYLTDGIKRAIFWWVTSPEQVHVCVSTHRSISPSFGAGKI